MSRDIDGIIKQKYAESGDVGLGGLDLAELWPISYSTPGGQHPQRLQFNQLFRYLSALGVEINSKGPFLEYDGTALIGPDYEIGAIVTGSDGLQYKCLLANGPGSTIVDPVGDVTGTWIRTGNQILIVVDEKTSGTQGGTFTLGAWRTRDLNTIIENGIAGSSLASDQITLPAGTYKLRGSAPAILSAQHKARVQDITGSTTLIEGTSERTPNAVDNIATCTRSFLNGVFTLAVESDIEIQHQCQETEVNKGFGTSTGFATEVFTEVEIWKI